MMSPAPRTASWPASGGAPRSPACTASPPPDQRKPSCASQPPSPPASHSACTTWCLREGPIGAITGEAGAGKPCAARAAAGGIARTRHHVIYLANPTLGVRGLHAAVVAATGGKPAQYTAILAAQAEHALAAEAEERGRRPVLLIDEAHLLQPVQLEALRMLTNSELDSNSPCTVILLGQPTLRRQIKH